MNDAAVIFTQGDIMTLQIITKEALGRLVAALQAADYRVAGPKPLHGQYLFDTIEFAR